MENEHTHECPQCNWTGTMDTIDYLHDMYERVAPGEIHPAGQCPECGALIEATDEDIREAGNVPNGRALLAQVEALIECADVLIPFMGERDPGGVVSALILQIEAAKKVVNECEGQS
jgi:hypothetical protein